MCGFAGIYLLAAFEPPTALRDRIDAMARAIAHRGPDAQNTVSSEFAAAGFRRLAIVDLHTGDQPVKNRTGHIEVFFNGEIYNHLELRDRLRQDHGIDIRQGSDAAVLPHLYEHYGPEFVQMCNGMFAICVIDHRTRTCRLYRDRLGIKPLYFAVTRDAVVFGSELKTLFASGLVAPAIDGEQVVPFLELFYVPGRATLARGVEKLMPGEMLVLRQDRAPERRTWWSLAVRRDLRPGDALAELDALLTDATRLQLMADVPIGISLSGGLDSSLIAYWAHTGDAQVRAYTIAFPDTDPGELACARAVARQLGIEHVEITADSGDFLAELDQTTWFNDEPVADPAFHPALMVAKAASRHVKVLLAGTGADELFAGYGHYQEGMRSRAYRLLSLAVGDRLAARAVGLRRSAKSRAAKRVWGQDRMPWHAHMMTHLTDADRQALRPVTAVDHLREMGERFAEAAWMDPRNQQLLVDTTTYLPHQLLSLLDRTTMGASIEGRVPFLDHRVAELAMAIHGSHKFRGQAGNKHLLRQLAARHLPPDVARRKKHGFPSAVKAWLDESRLPQIRDRLLARDGFAAGFFPGDWLQSLLADGDRVRDHAMTVHSLLVLQSWHRVFVQNARACPATAAAVSA
ncbi:MAG: asparagine synthase (glutamine-hydrolyzing) [Planctomycetes bacterium]|nr:asparagine synthase (glutamine-hydrolyzing) [Planctomycetota bacterium]